MGWRWKLYGNVSLHFGQRNGGRALCSERRLHLHEFGGLGGWGWNYNRGDHHWQGDVPRGSRDVHRSVAGCYGNFQETGPRPTVIARASHAQVNAMDLVGRLSYSDQPRGK